METIAGVILRKRAACAARARRPFAVNQVGLITAGPFSPERETLVFENYFDIVGVQSAVIHPFVKVPILAVESSGVLHEWTSQQCIEIIQIDVGTLFCFAVVVPGNVALVRQIQLLSGPVNPMLAEDARNLGANLCAQKVGHGDGRQDSNDRYNNQQLDQGERCTSSLSTRVRYLRLL